MHHKFSGLIIFLCLCSNLNAQGEKSTTLLLETGLTGLFDDKKVGVYLHLEPRHQISPNTVIGLRLGITLNTHSTSNKDVFQYLIDQDGDNGVISLVPTIEYRLRHERLHPYVGAGVGFYLLGDYIDVARIGPAGAPEMEYQIDVRNKPGLLIRGGIKPGRLRLGLAYNFVPKTDLLLPNGREPIGEVDISYLGLSLGLVFGGGKGN